jgi:hypothetical protein
VAALAILAVRTRRDGDQLFERPRFADRLAEAGEALLARSVEGGEEQGVERAEVVEDQRLVERALPRDRSRGRAGKALARKRLERRLDDVLSPS